MVPKVSSLSGFGFMFNFKQFYVFYIGILKLNIIFVEVPTLFLGTKAGVFFSLSPQE